MYKLYFTSYFFIMDTPGSYIGGNHVKHLSRREIENMKKNMKKVPIIAAKSDIYHIQEEQEAEKLLSKINENNK